MSEQALFDGATAFRRGFPRAGNPFDPNTEDWMCWRDGFDQASAATQRLADEAASAQDDFASPQEGPGRLGLA